MVAFGAPYPVQLCDCAAQPGECISIVKSALDETQPFAQMLPGGIIEGSTAVFPDIFFNESREIIMRPVAPSKTDQPEPCRQEAAVSKVVYGREKFLFRQIAGNAEQYKGTRPCNTGEP